MRILKEEKKEKEERGRRKRKKRKLSCWEPRLIGMHSLPPASFALLSRDVHQTVESDGRADSKLSTGIWQECVDVNGGNAVYEIAVLMRESRGMSSVGIHEELQQTSCGHLSAWVLLTSMFDERSTGLTRWHI